LDYQVPEHPNKINLLHPNYMSRKLSFFLFVMSDNPAKARKPRKDCQYSPDEMQVIGKYKEEYRQQTTRHARANVIRTKILVDLFNYWVEKGRGPVNEEDSIARQKVRPTDGQLCF
jgi:hypothetical protein